MDTVEVQTEGCKAAEPQKEHHWLQKMVGEWKMESEVSQGPGGETEKFEGTESVRSIGGLWVQAEGTGQMPDGSPATTLMTLGFNPQTGRFLGTWVGSMMSHLWVYDGELDLNERVLTLESEGPSMKGDGTLAKYRDVIEFKTDDYRTLSSYAPGENGEWQHFMTAHYRRVK